jgi:transposase
MLARNDNQARSFMTVPGIGPVTALCYRATIDEPSRFKRSRSVGAYVGLTTRRYASGEVDWTGRISKCGDAMLRSSIARIDRSKITSGVWRRRSPIWPRVSNQEPRRVRAR